MLATRSCAHRRPLPRIAVVSLATVGVTLLVPAVADAQARLNRLGNDECLVEPITAFEDVIMTGVATHHSGRGDVFQALCDAEDCFAFSINRDAGANVMTTGITDGEYDWFVCAWNGSVRRVVANLSGGAALFGAPVGGASSAARIVAIDDESVPEALRRFARRLARRTPDATRQR